MSTSTDQKIKHYISLDTIQEKLDEMRKTLKMWLANEESKKWLHDIAWELLGKKKIKVHQYISYVTSEDFIPDEIAILLYCHVYHLCVLILMKNKYWVAMNSDDSYTCPIKLAFMGKLKYEEMVQRPRKVPCTSRMVVIDNDTVKNEYVAEQGHSTTHPKERAVSCTPSIAPFTPFSSVNDPSKVHAIATVALENEAGTPMDMDNSDPDDVSGTASQQMVDTVPNAPNSSAQADLSDTTSQQMVDTVPNVPNSSAQDDMLGTTSQQMVDTVPNAPNFSAQADLSGTTSPNTEQTEANLMLLGNRKGMQPLVILQRIKMEVELDGNETNQTEDYDELDYAYENTFENFLNILKSLYTDGKSSPTPKMKVSETEADKKSRKHRRKKQMTLQVTTFILKKTEKVPQKPQLKCLECDRKYSCYKDLGSHLSTKHSSFVLKCSFCAETFESLQSQLHHEKRHEPFRFKCDQCKKSFQFQCELKQHSNIHLPNSKKFKCTSRNCNRRYSSLKALKLYTKVHDEVNYPCDECNKIFNSYQNLSQHKCGSAW